MASTQPDEREGTTRREMIATSPTGTPDVRRAPEDEATLKTVTRGSITQAVCGVGAAVLAILGLAGILVGYMVSVATIAIGVAFLAEGGAIAARWDDLMREAPSSRFDKQSEFGGGLGAEFVAGITGVVLGILALLGLYPAVLIPVAIVVFGGGLLLGSALTMDLGSIGLDYDRGGRMSRDATRAASGMQVLVGLGAIVLGILALVGFAPGTMSLVALLAIGTSILLSGSAVGTRMMKVLRH